MTSGLDDGVADSDCTLPACLQYKADAGTRWAYHNAAYTLLDNVVENATGQNFNTYVTTKIRSKIGMTGLFIKLGYNNIHFSTARSMARFGLLLLNKGKWNTTTVVSDTAYMRQMVNTSQNLNPSYGYLTWLNGKSALMVPQLQTVFPTSVSPQAPADMFAAMGKNGQLINVIPNQGLVVIRMGNVPDNSLVPFTYNNDIWKRLSLVICNRTAIAENGQNTEGVSVYPNPTEDNLFISCKEETNISKILIVNNLGQIIKSKKGFGNTLEVDISDIAKGMYLLQIHSDIGTITKKIVKN
jgi:CubicO group peptidase (beta-lactamase class C family)